MEYEQHYQEEILKNPLDIAHKNGLKHVSTFGEHYRPIERRVGQVFRAFGSCGTEILGIVPGKDRASF